MSGNCPLLGKDGAILIICVSNLRNHRDLKSSLTRLILSASCGGKHKI